MDRIVDKYLNESIDDEVSKLGSDFKDYILKTYKTPWHTLADATLRSAISNFKAKKDKKEGHMWPVHSYKNA
jgi:hypothetical protein